MGGTRLLGSLCTSIHDCAASPNAEGCETGDEGRSSAYDAEEPGAADAALGRSPKGRGISGGLLWRNPREGGHPSLRLASFCKLRHPIPKPRRRIRDTCAETP